MNKSLGCIILCQGVSLILGGLFYQSVREELEPALIQQGVAMGEYDKLRDFKEAGVEFPENLAVLPDKEVYVAPGLTALSQDVLLVTPAAILQLLAIGLSIRTGVSSQHSAAI